MYTECELLEKLEEMRDKLWLTYRAMYRLDRHNPDCEELRLERMSLETAIEQTEREFLEMIEETL